MNDIEIQKADSIRLFLEINEKELVFKSHNNRILEKIN